MIQTFPETFNFIGSKSEIEQMIGNAVPVNLGTFVATAIKNYIEGNQVLVEDNLFSNYEY